MIIKIVAFLADISVRMNRTDSYEILKYPPRTLSADSLGAIKASDGGSLERGEEKRKFPIVETDRFAAYLPISVPAARKWRKRLRITYGLTVKLSRHYIPMSTAHAPRCFGVAVTTCFTI